MNLFELAAKISLDSSRYTEGIKTAKRDIEGLGTVIERELGGAEDKFDDVGESASKATPEMSSFVTQLKAIATSSITVKVLEEIAEGLIKIAKAGVNYNMQIESASANLEVLLGDSEEAIAKIKELKAMDATSPFDLSDLLNATQQLLAYGIAAEDTGRVLQELGDISLGNTEKFSGLAYAYAQMNAAGKANMQDIRQMINAGFNPLNAIAELTGETMNELNARVSAGKVAFSEIEMAIKYATSAVGTFTQADRDAAAEFAKNQLTVTDAVQEQLDAQEAAYEAEVDRLDNMYAAQQKYYKKQQEALRDSIDERIDLVEKANEEELEALEKTQDAEVSAHKKATDAKLALIKEQHMESLRLIDEEKYNQIKAIEDQINALKGLSEADDKAARDKERAETKARLEQQVQNASNVRFRQAAEKQLYDYLESIRLEDLEEERKAKIEELKLQKQTVEEEATAKKDQLEEQYNATVEAAKSESEAVLEELKARHEEETKLVKEKHEEQLKDYKKTLDAELEALREKNDEALKYYKKDIDSQKKYATEQHAIALETIEMTQAAVTDSIESVEGRFFEGMSKQAETLDGKLAALQAKWNSYLGERSEGLTKWLENNAIPFADKLLDAADKFYAVVDKLFGIGEENKDTAAAMQTSRWKKILTGELPLSSIFDNYYPTLQTVTGTSNSSSTTITNNFTVQGVSEDTARKLAEDINSELEEAEAANG